MKAALWIAGLVGLAVVIYFATRSDPAPEVLPLGTDGEEPAASSSTPKTHLTVGFTL